jgi:RNA recognition motif-containing protein
MGKRLYVGNLSFDTTEAAIAAHFEEGGRKVSTVTIVQDRDTGRSRGFAFVEMDSDGDAQGAIQALDGGQFEGRSLKVNEAKERRPRASGQGAQ